MDTKAYTDMKARNQKEFDDFAEEWCFFAFSEQQLQEGMAKLRPKMAEGEKFVRFGSGMFCMKSKADELAGMAGRQSEEMRRAMEDREFAKAAFYYEMANHEYHINWQGDWDVCSCFYEVEYVEDAIGDFYLRSAGALPETRAAYMEARREFYRMAEEEGWF